MEQFKIFVKELLGEMAVKELNYNPSSLKILDELIELAHKRENLTEIDKKWIMVRMAYYLGECIIRNLNGEWVPFNQKLKKLRMYTTDGIPVIEGYAPKGYYYSPLEVIYAYWLNWNPNQKKKLRDSYDVLEKESKLKK